MQFFSSTFISNPAIYSEFRIKHFDNTLYTGMAAGLLAGFKLDQSDYKLAPK